MQMAFGLCDAKKMGPTCMNRASQRKEDTRENGKMFKRILTIEEEGVLSTNARGLKIEVQKGKVTRKESNKASRRV